MLYLRSEVSMTKSKIIKIAIIFCFCSFILIPIGLALMWFSTEWKKKLKVSLTAVLSLLYIGVVGVILLEPSFNTSGISLPGSYSKGSSTVESSFSEGKPASEKTDVDKANAKKDGESDEEEERLPRNLKKGQKGKNSSLIYVLLFVLAMVYLILRQNLKYAKKGGYENPYVDTNQYKLPLTNDAHMPMVHFLRLQLRPNEKIFYATETTQAGNEGDFIITNSRIVVMNKNESYDLLLNEIGGISSLTNTTLQLSSGEQKFYIFLPESQMKYAIAVTKWAQNSGN